MTTVHAGEFRDARLQKVRSEDRTIGAVDAYGARSLLISLMLEAVSK